jgi:hypothetical protein
MSSNILYMILYCFTEGFYHIGGNSFSILIFGSFMEIYHPLGLLAAFFVFQVSVISGFLCFSMLYPYLGVVGASPGAYGLIGACWFTVFAHRDLMDPAISFILPFLLFAILASDIATYLFLYDSTVAYSTHAMGMIIGFLMTMSMTAAYRRTTYLQVSISLIGLLAFSILVGILVWHYLVFNPPVAFIQPSFHNNYQRHTCCAQLFNLMENNPYESKAYLANSMTCDGY